MTPVFKDAGELWTSVCTGPLTCLRLSETRERVKEFSGFPFGLSRDRENVMVERVKRDRENVIPPPLLPAQVALRLFENSLSALTAVCFSNLLGYLRHGWSASGLCALPLTTAKGLHPAAFFIPQMFLLCNRIETGVFHVTRKL